MGRNHDAEITLDHVLIDANIYGKQRQTPQFWSSADGMARGIWFMAIMLSVKVGMSPYR